MAPPATLVVFVRLVCSVVMSAQLPFRLWEPGPGYNLVTSKKCSKAKVYDWGRGYGFATRLLRKRQGGEIVVGLIAAGFDQLV